MVQKGERRTNGQNRLFYETDIEQTDERGRNGIAEKRSNERTNVELTD